MTGTPASKALGFSVWFAISMTRAVRLVVVFELKRAGARKVRVRGRRAGRMKRGAIVEVLWLLLVWKKEVVEVMNGEWRVVAV
jgi:hypothetical protein